jgi:hypothetical protein
LTYWKTFFKTLSVKQIVISYEQPHYALSYEIGEYIPIVPSSQELSFIDDNDLVRHTARFYNNEVDEIFKEFREYILQNKFPTFIEVDDE